MTYFPFFENIDGKTFLVIGGGEVARGKVEKLKLFTDNIIVIAKETKITGVKILNKEFEDSDIISADYVIGATDDKALNERIFKLCRERNIPVNIVDNPVLCTFIFPSLVKRGDLTVAISTSGNSPALSRYLRQEIEAVIPENIEDILDEMCELRNNLKAKVPNQSQRAKILKNRLSELIK